MGETNPLTGKSASYQPLSDREQRELMPQVLPAGWQQNRRQGHRGVFDSLNMRVILSAGMEEDRKRWLHLSVSRRDGTLPSWEDLQYVKDVFAGRHTTAIHVYPAAAERYDAWDAGHVATNRVHVMHLWVPLDEDPIPNFYRARGGSL